MKKLRQRSNRGNSVFNTFELNNRIAQLVFDETNEYLQQRRDIKRKSDQLLSLTNMDYDKFCKAIDELMPPEMMDFWDGIPIGSSRNYIKALAPLYHENSGKSYYEIYLEYAVT